MLEILTPTETLTRREEQVLELIVAGKTTKQIAAELGTSVKTAACHRYRLMDKVGALNAADLVRRTITAPQHRGRYEDHDERVAAYCAALRQGLQLFHAEIERSRKLQRECKESTEALRFLHRSLKVKCAELARLVAMRQPATESNPISPDLASADVARCERPEGTAA